MSLDGLLEEVGRAVGDARQLFPDAPAPGAWCSTGGLATSRDNLAQSIGAATQGWHGDGASGYRTDANRRVTELDSVIDADIGTAAGFNSSADALQRGGAGMDTVIDDTHAGVAAISPSTDTPAGKAQLVAHLQQQLHRAKTLLIASERRNIELAALIRAAASGYRGGMTSTSMPMPPAAMSPMTAPSGGLDLPHEATLTGATHLRPAPPPTRPAADAAAQTAVRAALSKLGRPYVWGAKGPDAFDCSGLVRWAWAQAGVTLGADTYTQIEQGVPVAPGDVQPGDLIFPTNSFGEGGQPGPGHVMLAISPTACVEAQQTGVPVKLSPKPSAYVARRPLPQ
jgi:peptidoglycan DL-endopeptidase CwlO